MLERWNRILIGGYSQPGVGPTFRTETVIRDATPLSHFCSFDFCGELGGCMLPLFTQSCPFPAELAPGRWEWRNKNCPPAPKMCILINDIRSSEVCTGLWGPLFQRLSSRSFWENEI